MLQAEMIAYERQRFCVENEFDKAKIETFLEVLLHYGSTLNEEKLKNKIEGADRGRSRLT